MQVSFFNRLFAYMQGKKVVELYSSATLRSYFTVAIRNNQNQWICQIPRYDKQWEYITIILEDDGNLTFLEEPMIEGGLDRWK
jgi:hypothetical protein